MHVSTVIRGVQHHNRSWTYWISLLGGYILAARDECVIPQINLFRSIYLSGYRGGPVGVALDISSSSLPTSASSGI